MYRIGTISTGIMLILTGVIMLISQWVGMELISYIFKLWPIILVVMGLEILYYSHKVKDGNEKLKYDFWSIVMLFIMICLSVVAFIAGNLTNEIIQYFI